MKENLEWIKLDSVDKFNLNMGTCVKVKGKQIAIFNNNKSNWYAVDNLCPHKKQMVLSRGLMGSEGDTLKVSCPLHKRNFSLISGECLSDDNCDSINTYELRIENNYIFICI